MNEEHCDHYPDKTHCSCWWEGDECCGCGAPAMTPDEMAELGMENNCEIHG